MQYDNGVRIDQGALSNDPNSPPLSANIRTVIEQTGRGNYRVCDAQHQEDLQRIVDAHLGKGRVVFAGSLGLALALANRLSAARHRTVTGLSAHRPMMVCGSHHPQSVRQVERARGNGIRILSFDPSLMGFDVARELPGEGAVLVRILPGEPRTKACSPTQIMTSFIAALRPLLKQIEPDGLGIVGGETACRLLQRLGAKRLDVYQQQAEVIACARISGGRMHGCPMVSKGGSVGAEDAILQMLSILSTTICTKTS